jgi:predicted nucleotidyltransferase
VPAEAIYLFGSYAYGKPDADSDLDIYVVVPDGAGDIGELYAGILAETRHKRSMSLDLLLGRASVFKRRKSGPTLEREISERGRLLYGI